ncbi:GSCFA domain-containing protein [Polaribacter gochangensis]|uniref:GSCFA domain-containing protein n=1 Tax=Polaribacter gochangensis TaxID=3252903 RepID=UPI003904DC90
MILQTQIPIAKERYNPITYDSKILLLGSCFSENIGNKLAYYKFQSNQNPFGILFHSKAIENLISNAINEKEYTENDVFYLNERWHSFDAHSSLSSPDKNELLSHLNRQITATNQQLKNASHIIITLGTSWIYRFIETDTVVANCHKIPQKKFLKELLSVDEITESLEAIIALLKSVNQKVNVLFTVSPVRHLKDGFTQNQQSKSHVISAIHQVVEPRNYTHYFPSYEIMMDELRDYRFYEEDMIHPNKTAINYIWEKFSDSWISEDSKETMKEVSTIQNGLNHRPFNSNSEKHQQFLKNLETKKHQLQQQFSWMTF